MQQAWDAAIAAFAEFIAALVNGELIASGVHPASGVRCDLDPAEWTRRDLILDVRNGDLIELTRYGKSVAVVGHHAASGQTTPAKEGTRAWL